MTDGRAGLRVLLVYVSEQERPVIEGAVLRCGAVAATARTIREATQALSGGDVALLIVDVDARATEVGEFAEWLRSCDEARDTPIIFITPLDPSAISGLAQYDTRCSELRF